MLEEWKTELKNHQIRLTSSAGGVEERAGNPPDKAHL